MLVFPGTFQTLIHQTHTENAVALQTSTDRAAGCELRQWPLRVGCMHTAHCWRNTTCCCRVSWMQIRSYACCHASNCPNDRLMCQLSRPHLRWQPDDHLRGATSGRQCAPHCDLALQVCAADGCSTACRSCAAICGRRTCDPCNPTVGSDHSYVQWSCDARRL